MSRRSGPEIAHSNAAAHNIVLEWGRRGDDQSKVQRRPVNFGSTLTIGRAPDCTIVLNDPGVSRSHAQLEITPSQIIVRNVSQTGTSRIEGNAVATCEWLPGQRLSIGAFDFRFHVPSPHAVAGPAKASVRPLAQHAAVAPARPRPTASPVLRISWRNTTRGEPPDPRWTILPVGKVITIGKDPSCQIVLREPLVSREHARLEIGADGVRITDLDSTNGTTLGGEPIKQASWRAGQLLEIGNHSLSIEAVSASESSGKDLTAAFLGRAPSGATTAAASGRLRVFISYSRKDQAAADKLDAALRQNGFYVSIDRRLPYGEEWKRELIASIQGADTVVFLISPDSIASDWCRWELEQVLGNRKRLFPVRISDVQLGQLPAAIRNVQILPQTGIFDFAKNYPQLVKALQTDQAWAREHTRLFIDAMIWHAKGRPRAMLLHGVEINNALMWMAARPPRAMIAPQIMEHIGSSRTGRRLKLFTANGFFLALVFAALIIAWQFRAISDWATTTVSSVRAFYARLVGQKDEENAQLRRLNALLRVRAKFYLTLSESLGNLGIHEMGDRFIVPAGVLFDSGQANLTPGGREALGRIPRLIRILEDDRSASDIDWVLQVNGHTDKRPISTPQFPSNLELSTARATTVVKYLRDLGVSPGRLVAAGYGETQLLDQGESEESHRSNRRIELKLTDK